MPDSMLRSLLVSSLLATAALAADTSSVTFNRDVLPVLQKNCQTCHRPGEIGPMPLLTYEGTRPWAKAIKAAVLSKKMPPWFADPKYGHFMNDRSLSQAEIDTLAAWSDAGAPEGNAKDKPAPVEWVDGWNISKPDQVVEMPVELEVPAKGTVEYTYMIVPTGFTEDKWVQAIGSAAQQSRGGASRQHLYPAAGITVAAAVSGGSCVCARRAEEQHSSAGAPLLDENVAGYTPGKQTVVLRPEQAKLIPAGSDIVFQIHYTANGKETRDRTKLGLVFAKEPPQNRVARIYAANNQFVIPAGAGDYRVEASTTLKSDVELGVAQAAHAPARQVDGVSRDLSDG